MNSDKHEGFDIQSIAFRKVNDEDSILFERRPQSDGPDKWAIKFRNNVMNKEGHWEYEPMPSSRDDKYLERCRFDSLNACFEFMKQVEAKV